MSLLCTNDDGILAQGLACLIEAAEALGLSRSVFYDRVLPELRTILVGRIRLVPVAELERWADREARRLAVID